MIIERDIYLKQLIERRENGLVKVICGLRRSGKSFLLFNLFRDYLRKEGVSDDHIIALALDNDINAEYRSPEKLSAYIRSRIVNSKEMFYVFLDEVQYVISKEELSHPKDGIRLYDVLNGFLQMGNVDVYVTGSNSRMLSQDILTEFRGRGDIVQMNPLSFSEYYSAVGGDRIQAFEEYGRYGGMPLLLSQRSELAKRRYLTGLFDEVYFKDILERYPVTLPHVLSELTDNLCSAIGSLTNVSRIVNTLSSVQKLKVNHETIANYLETLKESFLFRHAQRYDVKGKKYFDYPMKFYCADMGLRNVRLNFRQQEETHAMENIIFNELLVRGYGVDVGVVKIEERTADGHRTLTNTEIDFVANEGMRRYYIQASLNMEDEDKQRQELRPLLNVKDMFRKIVITKTFSKPWIDEKGILRLNIYDFLLNPKAMDF